MSRRSRRERASAQTVHAPQIIDAGTGKPLAPESFAASAWDGANWSPNRGYIYAPTVDMRRDLDAFSRVEMQRRSFWLYKNVGFARRCIRGIANMVGSLTPVPLTKDKEWNQLAIKSFENDCGSAEVFDLSGKFDFWRAQTMLSRRRLLSGDHLAVFTTSQSGKARAMFYGSGQVRNGLSAEFELGMHDGVRENSASRALSYRVCSPDATDPLSESFVDIPAQSAVLHADYEDTGRSRGETILAHAINHMIDGTELLGYMKLASKQAAQIGYYITRAIAGGPLGMGAAVGPQNTPLNSRGTTGKALVEDAYRGGKIPEMNPGEEIKMLLDERPHPNTFGMLDHMARDISWGTEYSPEVLWNVVKLGGATMRFALADAQQATERLQYLMAEQFCARWWTFYLACEVKAKRLRPCQDPEWWLHGWQAQAKLTVDISRDGRLAIDMHQSGLITLKRWFASSLGTNWRPEIDQYLDERAYIKQGCADRGLSLQEAFPPRAGVANMTERDVIPDKEAQTE